MTEQRNPIGTHVPVGAGLVRSALRTMRELGADTLQVFLGNPRSWAPSRANPVEEAEFAAICAQQGVPAFVHASYLVNLGSPDPKTHERSVDAVAHSLARTKDIGARGLVVHTGSAVHAGGHEAALTRVREALLPLLETLEPDSPRLLLEPTAGQGASLCAAVDDLGPYLDALEHHPMLGICLDTCHVFAAGEPLDEPGAATAMVDRLLDVAGPGRLGLIHANDSKGSRGSRTDRHERIGQGRIGEDAFAEMLAHPATAGVPFVLETPGGKEAWGPDIARLRELGPHSLPARWDSSARWD